MPPYPENEKPTVFGFIGMILFILVIALTVRSCDKASKRTQWTTVTNVEAVFMNEQGSVTLLVRDANGLNPETYRAQSVTYVDDVKPGDGVYMQVMSKYIPLDGFLPDTLIVHLHSKDELQPGAWNHGKFGHGRTQRIM